MNDLNRVQMTRSDDQGRRRILSDRQTAQRITCVINVPIPETFQHYSFEKFD